LGNWLLADDGSPTVCRFGCDGSYSFGCFDKNYTKAMKNLETNDSIPKYNKKMHRVSGHFCFFKVSLHHNIILFVFL
jgi:hypothetical protein